MVNALEPIESARSTDDRWDRMGAWIRRASMCLLAAVVIAALCNVFGQRASTAQASSSQAELEVHAPTTARPGLLFQAKFTIIPKQVLPDAQLVLGRGWVDGFTINTIEPSPVSEHSRADGSLVFDLGALQPGQPWVQYVDYQVNPTSISRRAQVVTVLSGSQQVVSLHRTMTLVP
jgi:hypothetical protein